MGKCPGLKCSAFLGIGVDYSVQLGRWRQMKITTVTQFSDDEIYEYLVYKDFDLFELTEEEREELAKVINDDI